MYKNKPKPETHQAILAQIKKEMNEPRIAESAREEDGNQTTRQKLENCRDHRPAEIFASKRYVSRNANRYAFAHRSLSPRAVGAFPAAHQGTAKPS